MPIRRLLPSRVRRFYVGHRAAIGYLLLVAYVTAVGAWALHKIESESAARRDQNCVSFERQERAAGAQLQRTRDFLAKPHKTPLERQLVPLAKANEPQLVADAEASRAPAYCDAPGVGL